MFSDFVANMALYEVGILEGKWLVLPCDTDKLEMALCEIGVDKPYKEYFIYQCSSHLQCFTDVVNECSSIINLNVLADRLTHLTDEEQEKLEALHEAKEFSMPVQVLKASYELSSWMVYPAIHEYDELGKLYFEKKGAVEIPEKILSYFDFFKFGKEVVRNSLFSRFTSYGFVVRE